MIHLNGVYILELISLHRRFPMSTESYNIPKPWLTAYQDGVPEHINYEALTLPAYLDRSARDFPDNPALNFMGYTLNYTEFNDMVLRFAAYLYKSGVRKGDRVAIILPNVIPCVAAYYAILKIGGVVVFNNPLYTDTELLYQLRDSKARIAVVLDLLANRIIALRDKCCLETIVVTSIGDYLPFPKNILFPLVAKRKKLAAKVNKAKSVYRWKDIIRDTQPDPPEVSITFEDLAALQYTGGTTGVSKGAMLSHGNLSRQVQQIRAWFPSFTMGTETMLGALPFFHVFGMSSAMNLSVMMAWNDVLVPKPLPEPLLEMIKEFRPTFAPLVPTMYIGMLNHPMIRKVDMSCLKGCFSGSAPIPVEVIHEFQDRTGSLIVEGFGMTETSPVTHINPFVEGRTKVGSIGVPISDTEARIVNIDTGEDVKTGEPGELLLRGPQVMGGYWNKPEETSNVFTDGWLHTGDIARMDEDGYFYIVDRLKDMIISGGMNVYPRDIDEIMYQHPAVQDACAIGVPHEVKGEVVKVFVVLKKGFTATSVELIDFCKEKLARYKLPSEIEFRNELPRSAVGKILRRELREEELKARKNK